MLKKKYMELHVAFTHLIVGSDDEVLLGHWGVPGHAARDSTLLDAIGAGQNNSVFLRLLQVILHLMEKVVPIYVCVLTFRGHQQPSVKTEAGWPTETEWDRQKETEDRQTDQRGKGQAGDWLSNFYYTRTRVKARMPVGQTVLDTATNI